MGIFDRFRKKNPAKDEDTDRHYVDSLDYFDEKGKEDNIHCPECEKQRKHVRLVETEGETLECPECHYIHEIRRV